MFLFLNLGTRPSFQLLEPIRSFLLKGHQATITSSKLLTMGNTISALIDEKKGVNETKAVHDLELLQKLVDSQLDLFEKDLDA